jgi:predicted ATPase
MGNKIWILTGGPGSLKTTTISELDWMGHNTIPEAATQVITEQQEAADPALPWTDFTRFQMLVFRRQIDLESKVDGQPAFADRSALDGIAYFALRGMNAPRELIAHARDVRYAGVFILPIWPNYMNNNVRREDPETATRIQNRIIQTYRDLGYSPIIVPTFDTSSNYLAEAKKRAAFIEQYIHGQSAERILQTAFINATTQ